MQRLGNSNYPKFRIVVCENKYKRDGKYIENIGYFIPGASNIKNKMFFILKSRFIFWKSLGAKPTQTVLNLYKKCIKFIEREF
jgi:small subunit ribosomal protein S16